MSLPAQNSAEVLCSEILANARRESEEIVRRAKAEAEAIHAHARTESEKILREGRELAQIEARRRKELILATVEVEAGRLRSARIEELLGSIYENIRRRLVAPDFDCRQSVVVLAAGAIRQMPGANFIVKLSTANLTTFGAGLAVEIIQRAGRASLKLALEPDPTVTDGGVMVLDEEGTQLWDNRLVSRLQRLWPELRRQMALSVSLLEKPKSSGGEQ